MPTLSQKKLQILKKLYNFIIKLQNNIKINRTLSADDLLEITIPTLYEIKKNNKEIYEKIEEIIEKLEDVKTTSLFGYTKVSFFDLPIAYLKEEKNQSILNKNSNKKSEELKNYIIDFIEKFDLNLFSKITSKEINNFINKKEMPLREKLQNALNSKHNSSKSNIVFGKMAKILREKTKSSKNQSPDNYNKKNIYEIVNLKSFLSSNAPRVSLFNKKQSIRNRIKQSSNKYSKKKYENNKYEEKKIATEELQEVVNEINSKIEKGWNNREKNKLKNAYKEKFRKNLINNYKKIIPQMIQGNLSNEQLKKFKNKLPSNFNNSNNLSNYLEQGIQLPKDNVNYYDKKLFNDFNNFYKNSLKKLGNKGKIIGQGVHGQIILYPKYNIVVKTQDRIYLIKEIFIYLILLKYRLPFIIPMRIKCNDKDCQLLMPTANSSLKEFLIIFIDSQKNKDNIETVLINIIKQITEFVYITSLHNLFYTDLKPENILWICNEKNQLNLFISDIGGFYYLYDEMNKNNIPKNFMTKLRYVKEKNIHDISYKNVKVKSENRLSINRMKRKMVLILFEFYKDIQNRFLKEKFNKLDKINKLIEKSNANNFNLTLEGLNNFIQKL